MVLMMTTFYCTQWEEYFTGTLTLGYIGVTEAQISAMVIYLLTAYYGVPWWNNELHIPPLHHHAFGWGGDRWWSIRYGDIPMLVSALSMVPTALSNIQEVVAFHRKRAGAAAAGAGNNTTTTITPNNNSNSNNNSSSSSSSSITNNWIVGVVLAFYKLIPILVLSGGFLAWAAYSSIYYSHPNVYLLTYGFLVAGMVGRIVLDRVCVANFQPLQPLILPIFFVPFLLHHRQLEIGFLLVYCAIAIVAYFHFALSVIQDLCDALQINCLHLGKQNKIK